LAKPQPPPGCLGGGVRASEATRSVEDGLRETTLSLGRIGIYDYVNRNPDASDEGLTVQIRNFMAASPVNPTRPFGEALVRRSDFPFIKAELFAVNPSNISIASTSRPSAT
jgi:hypothetical protein